MCDPLTIATTATVLSGVTSAVGMHQQGQMAKAAGRNNQIVAEYAARDAQRRGEEQAVRVQQQARQLKGTQRARLAANGVDLGVGTAAELQDQTDFFAEQDAGMARYNAASEAQSLRYRGKLGVAEGNAAARQANAGAFGTLLGTGATVADRWMKYYSAPDPRDAVRGQRGYD